MAAQVEIAAMGHALQFAEFSWSQERESVFDVGRAAGIMAQFRLLVIPQTQPVAGQAQVQIPAVSPVAPVLVPLGRRRRMAEKLDLHLLEFPRAEGKIPRRDLVAKTLAHLCYAKGIFTRVLSRTFLKLTKIPWAVSGRRNVLLFSLPLPRNTFQHQVELPRRG